jgi:hypothetical protein
VKKLEDLQAALDAATPGDWMDCGNGNVYAEGEVEAFVGQLIHNPDAQFIAQAKNLMPKLLSLPTMIQGIHTMLKDHPDVANGNSKVHFVFMACQGALALFEQEPEQENTE